MEENLFDAGGFLICFPCWFLEHHEPNAGGFLTARHPDGDIGTPVFTDEAAALAFLESGPMPEEYRTKPIADPLTLLGLLTLLEAKGFTHVTLDPVGSRARSFAIPALRAFALGWFRHLPDAST